MSDSSFWSADCRLVARFAVLSGVSWSHSSSCRSKPYYEQSLRGERNYQIRPGVDGAGFHGVEKALVRTMLQQEAISSAVTATARLLVRVINEIPNSVSD